MNDLTEETKVAISASIAQQILAGLDTKARGELLSNSIVKVLRGYTFEKTIENIVAAKAQEVAAEMVQEDGWTARIREAIDAGFKQFLSELGEAMTTGMDRLLLGREWRGSYDQEKAAWLLGVIQDIRKQKQKPEK